MPALGLTGCVLQREGEHGVALLDRILLVGLAGLDGAVDGVESGGGRELVYLALSAYVSAVAPVACRMRIPFLRDMLSLGWGGIALGFVEDVGNAGRRVTDGINGKN